MEYSEFIESYKKLLYDSYDSSFNIGVELEFGSNVRGSILNKELSSLDLTNAVFGDGSKWSNHGKNISYDNWNITYDASVNVANYRTLGAEVVSPILNIDTICDLENVMTHLNSSDKYMFNDTCGTHVHFSNSFSKQDVKSFVKFYMDNIGILEKIYPLNRRNSTYTKRPKQSTYFDFQNVKYDHDRYSHININNYNKTGTIELRLHEATFDFIVLISTVILFQHIFIYTSANNSSIIFESIEHMCKTIGLDDTITSFIQTKIIKYNSGWYYYIKDDAIISNI